ncbi:M23 family metallopeptidase [Streptomyces sp. NPDC000594]|uniref:M23 family metallopeptidase n=1 Tax=Streptomyces sp. NPDC000594 TaxID=3154261 RepID=UPI00332AEA99
MGLRYRARLPLAAGAALCALLLTPVTGHAGTAAGPDTGTATASVTMPAPAPSAVTVTVSAPASRSTPVPVPAPVASAEATTGGMTGPGTGSAGAAEVTRLHEEVDRAVAAHARGRYAARSLRLRADGLQRRLERQRRELQGLQEAMGAYARAQYRTGGPLAVTARLLNARDPDDLLRGRRYAHQAETAAQGLLVRARLAERRYTAAERRARAAWRDLEDRGERLSEVRREIEEKLARAREVLLRAEGTGTGSGCTGTTPPAGTAPEPPEPPEAPEAPAPARWVAPVRGYLLSAGYGRRGTYWAGRHTGQDFAVPVGTPVHSVGTGRVLTVSCGGPFGLEIVVRHPDGFRTQYAHLASATVAPGAEVRTGQRIGLAGTTGNSTGPHLHFEARTTPAPGSAVDPVAWLRARGVLL